MRRSVSIVTVLLAMALGSQVHAQGLTDANREMINATGQADAMALVCGKWNEAQIKAHKAEARRIYLADGVAPAVFEATYMQGFNEVKALAKTNHVQPGHPMCQRRR